MSALLIGYHPDFGWGEQFRRRSQLDSVANALQIDCVFPDGDWGWFGRTWRDKDERAGVPSYELAKFDRLTQGRRVILCGYSRGACLANYLATYRSHQVDFLATAAGRLQRTDEEILSEPFEPFPVIDVWREHDRRFKGHDHLRLQSTYRKLGCQIKTHRLLDGKRHRHGWPRVINREIIARMRDDK